MRRFNELPSGAVLRLAEFWRCQSRCRLGVWNERFSGCYLRRWASSPTSFCPCGGRWVRPYRSSRFAGGWHTAAIGPIGS